MKRFYLFILTFLMAVGILAAPKLPDYKGQINDQAGILSRNDIQRLESKVKAYYDKTGNEIGVLIVSTLGNQSLEDYAHDVFKAWGIGQKDKDNGVLFLVAIQEKKARIEVGYGLEAELTDLECGRLVNRNSPMATYFRRGDYAGGVNAVIDGIEQGIGGEYNPPKQKNEDDGKASILIPILFIIFTILIISIRRQRLSGRRFGGPFTGGFGGGIGGFSGGGGGGGFTFGGGSSGGGGASGGW